MINSAAANSIVAIVGLGFGLIYYSARAFHIAHGAVYVIGAYALWASDYHLQLPGVFSLVFAVLIAIFVGLLIDVIAYRPLLARSPNWRDAENKVLVSSIGAYMAIVGGLVLAFGNTTVFLDLDVRSMEFSGGARASCGQIWQLISALLVVVALWLFTASSKTGLMIRALADDIELFRVSGRNPQVWRFWIFVTGSALAGIGGCLSVSDVGIDPRSGFEMILKAATAAIIGGQGNMLGPVAGAAVLLVLETVINWQLSSEWVVPATFVLLLLVLSCKPDGLFPAAQRDDR